MHRPEGSHRVVAALTLVLLSTLPATAREEGDGTPDATPEQELLAASQAVADAQVQFDLEALDALLAPDYVEVSPIGEVDERAEVLSFYTPEAKEKMLAGGVQPISVSLVEPRIRTYGNHAVVVTRQDAELEVQGASQRRSFRATYHFRRIDDKWLLQSAQFTPIPEEQSDTAD